MDKSPFPPNQAPPRFAAYDRGAARAQLDAGRAALMARPAAVLPPSARPPGAVTPPPHPDRPADVVDARRPVEHAKIHEADIPARPGAAPAGWLSRARACVSSDRKAGAPRASSLMQVAGALGRFARDRGRDACRATHRELANASQVSVSTVRRALRWMEARDLVDTVNVLARVSTAAGAKLVRRANLYLFPAELDTVPAIVAGVGNLVGRAVRRWAAPFGLGAGRMGFQRPPHPSG
jgi:hypothetical protein